MKTSMISLGEHTAAEAFDRNVRWLTTALCLFAAVLVLLSGCATKPVAKVNYTFFPPPPDEPRIQFLTTISSEADIATRNKFADFVTGKPKSDNPLIKPYGVAMNDGKIFVCDTMANAIEVFDLAKKRSTYFAPRGEGKLQMPINITIDKDGTRYVADTGRGQVLIFHKDDYYAAIGTKEEMNPSDVAVTADRLYVTDLKGHTVRVYEKATQKFLFTIPRDPKTAKDKLFSPTNLAIDSQGHLVVSDTGAFTVRVYDLEGNLITSIGQQGVAPGLFARPKGIAVDREGLIYVVDAATQVAQVFNLEGKLLLFFGQPDTSVGGDLHLPAAIDINYDNVSYFQDKIAPGYRCEYLILVTSQVGPNKVNVYGFLKRK